MDGGIITTHPPHPATHTHPPHTPTRPRRPFLPTVNSYGPFLRSILTVNSYGPFLHHIPSVASVVGGRTPPIIKPTKKTEVAQPSDLTGEAASKRSEQAKSEYGRRNYNNTPTTPRHTHTPPTHTHPTPPSIFTYGQFLRSILTVHSYGQFLRSILTPHSERS